MLLHFFRRRQKAARQGEALSVVWKRGVETLPLDSKDQETLMGLDLTGDEENLRKGISLAVHRLQSTAEEWERRRPGMRKSGQRHLFFRGGTAGHFTDMRDKAWMWI